MEYIQLDFILGAHEEYQKEIFVQQLAEIGFDSFVDNEQGFEAYVQKGNFNEQLLDELLAEQSFVLQHKQTNVAPRNWNEEWESHFKPLLIDDCCYIRATFHEPMPQYDFEIVIDPKMAFGTGHHQTTTMMIKYILEEDFANCRILDMGAGTAILGILAAKKGAKSVLAIDYDEVCYHSALENAQLNQIPNLTALCGGKEIIPQQQFDVIFANINRNILLDQMSRYAEVLVSGGRIFFSGFYEQPDLDMIKDEALKHQLVFHDFKKIDDWVAAKFIRK